MVHNHRYQLLRKYQALRKGEKHGDAEDEESQSTTLILECGNSRYCCKRSRPKLLPLLLLSALSCSLILAPHLFGSLLDSFGGENEDHVAGSDVNVPMCSSASNGTICCDRSSIRADICFMKGDVRTQSTSHSLNLYIPGEENDYMSYGPGMAEELKGANEEEFQHEKIRPYTRKWETSVMDTISELHLVSRNHKSSTRPHCDVKHDVPAVFFSTGGYTGNVYHEFNDGILPLYITSQHLKKKVVFVIIEYHNWWVTKYGDILSRLSEHPPIDFYGDKRIHCFPEAIVGMRIHDELTVDSSLMEGNESIVDFRNVLDKAYWPRIRGLMQDEAREMAQLKEREKLSHSPSSKPVLRFKTQELHSLHKPKLVILSRNGSRALLNEDSLVRLAENIGFRVEVLRPTPTTELAKVYRVLNSSDVMVGVHGAAMTHFLFMKPGSVFIQVVPLGTVWAAETYYGEPAVKLGLKYIGYKIVPRESSLYDEYDKDDPVLTEPESVSKKGWEVTKKIYLDRQNVRLNLGRFQKRLVRAYHYTSKMHKNGHVQ